jgi:anti-anti-sigma factor
MTEMFSAPQLRIERSGRALVATTNARMIDIVELSSLGRLIDDALDPVERVVLDLSNVYVVPSEALALLVRMSARCRSQRRTLKLVGVRPQIRQVLALTAVDLVLDLLSSDVEVALD